MLFGFASFAERPFSTVDDDNNVTIQVTGNTLQLSIGNVNIIAGTVVEIPNPNRLILGTGSVTVTGTALITPVGSQLVVDSKQPGIITWNEIIPGVTMTWTEIKPY